MAHKQFDIDSNTTVTVYKRRAARNLRLSIDSNGLVRVSIPTWAPYKTGIDFAKSRLSWIETNRPVAEQIKEDQLIGKAHHIHFQVSQTDKISSRVKNNEIIVSYPSSLSPSADSVQDRAKAASIRALKAQSEALLPVRLDDLASDYRFTYKSLQIKRLTSRWGSCDQSKNITLNLYLMQLPWHLIDYVLLHELTHTKVFKHGPDFWIEMDKYVKDSKKLKKELKNYKTTVSGIWHNTNHGVQET